MEAVYLLEAVLAGLVVVRPAATRTVKVVGEGGDGGHLLQLHLVVRAMSHRKRPFHPDELFFLDPKTRARLSFARLKDDATVDLSIVFPCFNEEKRLGVTMSDTLAYLKDREAHTPSFTWEIIIVDDCSRDRTNEVALSFSQQEGVERVRVLSLTKNRGKGGAVTEGVLRSRGRYILFADGDNATSIHDVEALEREAKKVERDGLSLGVGSRAHLVGTDVVVKRSFIRNFLMRGFHAIVYVLGVKTIKDTQCGFKLFSRKAAQLIFPSMHTEGWIFDIELFILAERFKIPTVEVGVNWHEVEGSKLSLVKDSFFMLRDLFVIRYNYTLGIWAPQPPSGAGLS